jgi:hypothetical protein
MALTAKRRRDVSVLLAQHSAVVAILLTVGLILALMSGRPVAVSCWR